MPAALADASVSSSAVVQAAAALLEPLDPVWESAYSVVSVPDDVVVVEEGLRKRNSVGIAECQGQSVTNGGGGIDKAESWRLKWSECS